MNKLLEIEARLKAATPGPYEVIREDRDAGDIWFDVWSNDGSVAHCGEIANLNAIKNAEFFAHAPTDIAELIRAVREADDFMVSREIPNCPCELCAENAARARSWREKWGSR